MVIWEDFIKDINSHATMVELKDKLDKERKEYNILPDRKDIFSAFQLCPYAGTKIVILGQDPYPDPKHPHGLAFSSKSPSTPSSLSNIFKEIRNELYPDVLIEEIFKSNNLTSWAKQGILLMNTTLTTREGSPGSHAELGWEYFTAEVMKALNNHPESLVFMLWGNHAKKYAQYIIRPDHLILNSAHPSGLSADRGFFGNMHFRTAESFLRRNFYLDISNVIHASLDQDRLHQITMKFFEKNGIEIKTGNVDNIYNIMFNDIGLFFDELIPPLKERHSINWRT